MPVLFPNAAVFLSVRYSGRPWQGGSSTDGFAQFEAQDLNVKRNLEEMRSYFLQICPLQPFLDVERTRCGFHNELPVPSSWWHSWMLPQTPWTEIQVGTMFLFTEWKVIACTSAVQGRAWSSILFEYLGVSFLAWSQVCDIWLVETSSRYFCYTVSDSSAVWRLLLNFHQLSSSSVQRITAKTELWFSIFI